MLLNDAFIDKKRVGHLGFDDLMIRTFSDFSVFDPLVIDQ